MPKREFSRWPTSSRTLPTNSLLIALKGELSTWWNAILTCVSSSRICFLNSPTPSDIISVSSPCIQTYRSHSLVTTLAYFSLRHLNLYPIINLCNYYASFACPLLCCRLHFKFQWSHAILSICLLHFVNIYFLFLWFCMSIVMLLSNIFRRIKNCMLISWTHSSLLFRYNSSWYTSIKCSYSITLKCTKWMLYTSNFPCAE